ncbi:MAG: hypothetical protein RLZZ628_452 [Bacteroidota bacterium]|jgi:hypothetical protein
MNLYTPFFKKTLLAALCLIGTTAAFAVDYVSNGSGNWNSTSTWLPNGVPGTNDNVKIIPGHTITLNIAPTIASLTMTGGLITSTRTSVDSITITGNVSISGATFAPAGKIKIGGTLLMNDGTLGASTISTVTDITVAGAVTFTHTNSDNQIFKKRIVLNGGGTWTATVNNSSRIWVRSGSIFEIPVGKTLTYNSSVSTNFENDEGASVELKGTLIKKGTGGLSMGSSAPSSNILLNNTGSIFVEQGVFSINSPYAGAGSIAVASGATLNISTPSGLNYLSSVFTNNGTVNSTLPLIFNAAIPQMLTGKGKITQLTLNNPNNLSITDGQIITTLTLTSGKILLQKGDLDVTTLNGGNSSNFIVTQNTGRLVQVVGTTEIIFPIGPTVASYNPVTLKQAQGAVMAQFCARVKIGLDNPLNKLGYVNRQWTVDNTSGMPNATMGLSWQSPDHETGTFSTASNRIYLRSSNNTWSAASTTSADGAATLASGLYTRTQQNLTQFSTQFVVSSCVPPPPLGGSVSYCLNETVSPNSKLLWYTTSTGGTGLPTPSTKTAGTTTYFVSQTEDCESARIPIQVLVKPLPAAPAVSNVAYCQNATAIPLTATGSSLLWYNALTGGAGSAIAPTPSTATVGTTNYFVSQTVNGCESPRSPIQVVIKPLPTATIAGATTLCGGSSVTLTASGGTTYKWSTNATTPSVTVNTVGNYTVTVTDANGCTNFKTANVPIDNTAPIFSACPTNIVLSTSTTCAVATWVAPTATDNCPITVSSNYKSGFCFPLGTTTVVYTATDGTTGNKATCSFDVIVSSNCTNNTFSPVQCYKIVNRKSGKVLDVLGKVVKNNVFIVQNPFENLNAQKWQILSVPNGSVRIVAKQDNNKSITSGGVGVYLNSVNDPSSQWVISCISSGFFKITHRLSNQILGVKDASINNDADVVLKAPNGGLDQEWSIVSVACAAATQNNAPAMVSNQRTIKDALVVYPNPATDKITIGIQSETDMPWTIQVMNSIGKTLWIQQGLSSQTLEIDTKLLTNGLYLVEYQSNGIRKVEKIMIEH